MPTRMCCNAILCSSKAPSHHHQGSPPKEGTMSCFFFGDHLVSKPSPLSLPQSGMSNLINHSSSSTQRKGQSPHSKRPPSTPCLLMRKRERQTFFDTNQIGDLRPSGLAVIWVSLYFDIMEKKTPFSIIMYWVGSVRLERKLVVGLGKN